MAVLYSNLAYAYFGDKKYEQSIGRISPDADYRPAIF